MPVKFFWNTRRQSELSLEIGWAQTSERSAMMKLTRFDSWPRLPAMDTHHQITTPFGHVIQSYRHVCLTFSVIHVKLQMWRHNFQVLLENCNRSSIIMDILQNPCETSRVIHAQIQRISVAFGRGGMMNWILLQPTQVNGQHFGLHEKPAKMAYIHSACHIGEHSAITLIYIYTCLVCYWSINSIFTISDDFVTKSTKYIIFFLI